MNALVGSLLDVVSTALYLYTLVIIASAIFSWLYAFNIVNSHNQVINTIGRVLYNLTEPALRPIRRFMPNLGGIDISPVILLLIIMFLQSFIARLSFQMQAKNPDQGIRVFLIQSKNSLSVFEFSRFIRQHDRNAVADRIGQLGRSRDQLPGIRVVFKGRLGNRTDKQFKQFNETLTQFVTGFYSPSEKDQVAAKINAAANGVESLEQYCKNVVETCLPADYKTRECSVVMHYRNSEAQYLSVAKKASLNNGRVFAAHPERTLELSEWFKSNCMGLKDSSNPAPAAAAPTPSNINWG